MSLIVLSRSSGSSGPNPKTSSMTSPRIASRSLTDSGTPVFGNQRRHERPDFRLDAAPFGRRELLEVELRQQLAMHAAAHFQVLRPARVDHGIAARSGLRSGVGPNPVGRRFDGDWGSHGLEQSQERCASRGSVRRPPRAACGLMICLVNRSNRAARSEWFVSVSGTPEFIAADTTL